MPRFYNGERSFWEVNGWTLVGVGSLLFGLSDLSTINGIATTSSFTCKVLSGCAATRGTRKLAMVNFLSNGDSCALVLSTRVSRVTVIMASIDRGKFLAISGTNNVSLHSLPTHRILMRNGYSVPTIFYSAPPRLTGNSARCSSVSGVGLSATLNRGTGSVVSINSVMAFGDGPFRVRGNLMYNGSFSSHTNITYLLVLTRELSNGGLPVGITFILSSNRRLKVENIHPTTFEMGPSRTVTISMDFNSNIKVYRARYKGLRGNNVVNVSPSLSGRVAGHLVAVTGRGRVTCRYRMVTDGANAGTSVVSIGHRNIGTYALSVPLHGVRASDRVLSLSSLRDIYSLVCRCVVTKKYLGT